MSLSSLNLLFLGFGNMGAAIARGLNCNNIDALVRSKRSDEKKVKYFYDVKSLPKNYDAAVIAVKPNQVADILPTLPDDLLQKDGALISVIAGIPLVKLQNFYGKNGANIVRTMPNTPLAIGVGMTGVYLESGQEYLKDVIENLFCGNESKVVYVKEEGDLDKVTAISGSGVAYFFLLAELIASELKISELSLFESMKNLDQAGDFTSFEATDYSGNLTEILRSLKVEDVNNFLLSFANFLYLESLEMGLAKEQSKILVEMTIKGAGIFGESSINNDAIDAKKLRENVTSLNGTTAAALAKLSSESGGLRNIIRKTVLAAKNRAKEIAAS